MGYSNIVTALLKYLSTTTLLQYRSYRSCLIESVNFPGFLWLGRVRKLDRSSQRYSLLEYLVIRSRLILEKQLKNYVMVITSTRSLYCINSVFTCWNEELGKKWGKDCEKIEQVS